MAAIQMSFSGIGRPFDLSLVLYRPVDLRGSRVAAQNLNRGGELFDLGQVTGRIYRLARAVVELAQNGAGHKHFGIREVLGNRALSREKCDDDVGVEKDFTSHSARSFRNLPGWHATWHRDPRGQYSLRSA